MHIFRVSLLLFLSGVGAAQASAPHPTPGEIAASFRVAEGYEVNLFASEADLPLHNPITMEFDAEGRLWVAVAPTYPIYAPGTPPSDKLLVLEDTDRDGVMDRHSVFADGLYVPTGFALDAGGIVYVAQQPELWKLTDTDGDLVADRKEVVLSGFGTEDSHHSLSAFTWAPGGHFTFNEGVFHHTQVETPYGPRRARDAAVFGFQPLTHRLEVLSHRGYANPWGHAYDRWGQSSLSDASDGNHYSLAHVMAAFDYPEKSIPAQSFLRRGRPMSGNTFLSSAHFPGDVQGTHVNNQCIGFHGVRWDRLVEEGSAWRTEPLPDLLQSDNPVFRPVDAKVGGDGALYVLDFSNPIIGHMQYSHRDPRRDSTHGRIWRITCKGRELSTPPPVTGQPIPQLLELLGHELDGVRHFARRELVHRDRNEVLRALSGWTRTLDAQKEGEAHPLLEALWVYQSLDRVDRGLLAQVLGASDARARAAATRVLRHWLQAGKLNAGTALDLLTTLAEDSNQRVRLEAVLACGFAPNGQLGSSDRAAIGRRAAGVALLATRSTMDANFQVVLRQTLKVLSKFGEPEAVVGRRFLLESMEPQALLAETRTELVCSVILGRADIDPSAWEEALRWLVENRGRTRTEHLLDAFESAVRGEAAGFPAASLLRREPVAALRSHADRLVALVAQATSEEAREEVLATVVQAAGLERALGVASTPADALRAILRIHDTAALTSCAPRLASMLPESGDLPPPPVAQTLRIELPRRGTLSLAEVEVWSEGTNVARDGSAKQSSLAHGGVPERAIDGDTNGIYGQGSITHSVEGEDNPWWELDLGESRPIDGIRIWNRTEGTLGRRLDGFTMTLKDTEGETVWQRQGIPAPPQSVRLAPVPTRAEVGAALAAAGHAANHDAALATAFLDSVQAIRVSDPATLWPEAKTALELYRGELPPALADVRASAVPAEVMERGAAVYASPKGCVICHQPNGQGLPGAFPPLVDSPWVEGDETRLIKIVLRGLMGKLEVKGQSYSSAMAPLAQVLTDAEIADALTYVRNAWGNEAPAVAEGSVAAVRAATAERVVPYTVEEILAEHPLEDDGH